MRYLEYRIFITTQKSHTHALIISERTVPGFPSPDVNSLSKCSCKQSRNKNILRVLFPSFFSCFGWGQGWGIDLILLLLYECETVNEHCQNDVGCTEKEERNKRNQSRTHTHTPAIFIKITFDFYFNCIYTFSSYSRNRCC